MNLLKEIWAVICCRAGNPEDPFYNHRLYKWGQINFGWTFPRIQIYKYGRVPELEIGGGLWTVRVKLSRAKTPKYSWVGFHFTRDYFAWCRSNQGPVYRWYYPWHLVLVQRWGWFQDWSHPEGVFVKVDQLFSESNAATRFRTQVKLWGVKPLQAAGVQTYRLEYRPRWLCWLPLVRVYKSYMVTTLAKPLTRKRGEPKLTTLYFPVEPGETWEETVKRMNEYYSQPVLSYSKEYLSRRRGEP